MRAVAINRPGGSIIHRVRIGNPSLSGADITGDFPGAGRASVTLGRIIMRSCSGRSLVAEVEGDASTVILITGDAP